MTTGMMLCADCHEIGGCEWAALESTGFDRCGRCGRRTTVIVCAHSDLGLNPIGSRKSAGTFRTPDHHTSIGAALKDLGRRGGQRERIALAHFAHPAGLTDEEAANFAKLAPQSSPWKRCTELREWGYLVWAGIDRPTSTGTDAKVWRLTDDGLAAIRPRRAATG